MTHTIKDNVLCSRQGFTGAVRLALAVLGFVVAAGAAAEVKLENSVQKVEITVNEAGEVERNLVDSDSVVPGDELRYTISFSNSGAEVVDAASIVITNPVPESTEYLEGTAFGAGTEIIFSVNGEVFAAAEALTVVEGGVEVPASAKDYKSIRWTFQPELAPGESSYVSFNVRLK